MRDSVCAPYKLLASSFYQPTRDIPVFVVLCIAPEMHPESSGTPANRKAISKVCLFEP